ncbi:MAG TPA: DoxX family protein [Solirubrobacteraceae bacterium]
MPHAHTASSVNTSDQPVQLRLIVTVDDPPAADSTRPTRARLQPGGRLDRLDAAMHGWLVAHSMALLRLSLGVVFLAFGALKFFPGVSPAENLVKTTADILTFGLVPGSVALAAVAAVECVIGLCLISGRALRGAIYLLVIQLVGILSPVVLLTARLFSGPHHAPTLEGQYVIKDIVLVAATLVLASTLRGARLQSESHRSHLRRG